MIRNLQLLLSAAGIAALQATGAAYAQATDHLQCRSGTASILAQDEKKVVMLIDHRGVAQGGAESDPFHNSTQRCIGVLANFDGKVSANGWCKQIFPQTGDWLVLDWANAGKPGSGTWTIRHGVGKFKGATGSGTYESLAPTKPVEAGTYQSCIRVKGTLQVAS